MGCSWFGRNEVHLELLQSAQALDQENLYRKPDGVPQRFRDRSS